MEFIELRDIYKTYHLGEIDVPVLRGISLTVSQGEFVALMGTSGSGKTTLMNILGCLDRPSSGEYWLEGKDVVALSADEWAQLRNQKIGFVFQTFNLLPRTSALENVTMPLSYTAAHLSDQEARQRAEDLLHRVGLGERLDHDPSQLSGGQQQRVAIARALINNPSILFADEPTGNLDSKTSDEVLELFRKLNEEEGVTIILVTHDANVARFAKRIIRITDGMVEAEEPQAPAAQGGQVGASPPAGSVAKRHSGLAWVRLEWMVRTALHGLRRNVMRAALTTLGIVIGVAAVIAMMEIG
ncbi:MAG: ATP-binding cassette domain-containing protein, partial [Proteobacteria bacterium]|nr:ATP-binding cassette domain-containing protein [Pseudomonadota bacterium]